MPLGPSQGCEHRFGSDSWWESRFFFLVEVAKAASVTVDLLTLSHVILDQAACIGGLCFHAKQGRG